MKFHIGNQYWRYDDVLISEFQLLHGREAVATADFRDRTLGRNAKLSSVNNEQWSDFLRDCRSQIETTMKKGKEL